MIIKLAAGIVAMALVAMLIGIFWSIFGPIGLIGVAVLMLVGMSATD